jgi:hypothetical protein
VDSNPAPAAVVGWGIETNIADYLGSPPIHVCAIVDVYNPDGSYQTGYKQCGPAGRSGDDWFHVRLDPPKRWNPPFTTVATVYNGTDYAHTIAGWAYGTSY